jgi:hypothetical protein
MAKTIAETTATKLIIQKLDGEMYIYREGDSSYKICKSQRPKTIKKNKFYKMIDEECCMSSYNDFVYVVDL